jgi:hypothetical protein
MGFSTAQIWAMAGSEIGIPTSAGLIPAIGRRQDRRGAEGRLEGGEEFYFSVGFCVAQVKRLSKGRFSFF